MRGCWRGPRVIGASSMTCSIPAFAPHSAKGSTKKKACPSAIPGASAFSWITKLPGATKPHWRSRGSRHPVCWGRSPHLTAVDQHSRFNRRWIERTKNHTILEPLTGITRIRPKRTPPTRRLMSTGASPTIPCANASKRKNTSDRGWLWFIKPTTAISRERPPGRSWAESNHLGLGRHHRINPSFWRCSITAHRSVTLNKA